MNLTNIEISKLMEDKVSELSVEERDDILVAVIGAGLESTEDRRVRADLLRLVFGDDTDPSQLDPLYDGALLAALRTKLSEDPSMNLHVEAFNTLLQFRDRLRKEHHFQKTYFNSVWDGEIGTT